MAKAKKSAKPAKKVKMSAKPKAKAKTKPAVKAKASGKTTKSTKPTKKPMTAKAKAAPAAKKAALSKDLSAFMSPLDDRIIVDPAREEQMTAGGLYIPDTVASNGNTQGVILALGRGHRNKKGRIRPMDVKLGDKVLFAQHSGNEIEVMGHKLLILRESEILGVLTK